MLTSALSGIDTWMNERTDLEILFILVMPILIMILVEQWVKIK